MALLLLLSGCYDQPWEHKDYGANKVRLFEQCIEQAAAFTAMMPTQLSLEDADFDGVAAVFEECDDIARRQAQSIATSAQAND